MSYRIVYAERFIHTIERQLAYLNEQKVSPQRIDAWFEKLFRAIESLEIMPHRYPISVLEHSGQRTEARKLVFGNYLVFYQINEEQKTIEILRFRHGSQDDEDHINLDETEDLIDALQNASTYATHHPPPAPDP